jgi:hypothetical protein
MGELRDFITARLAEIEPQIADMETKLAPLRAEMADLKRALHALDLPSDTSGLSIQGQALAVLKEHPDGLSPHEIGAEIEKLFGRTVQRVSLSPQLSRLVRKDLIAKRGGVYVLGDRP